MWIFKPELLQTREVRTELISLSVLGQHDDALATALEAVDIERHLDEVVPNVHRPTSCRSE